MLFRSLLSPRPALALRLAIGVCLGLIAGVALPNAIAVAQSAETMTPDQREAFRAEIRAFLLEEPEIITEALRELERRRVSGALEDLDALVAAGEIIMEQGPADASLTLIELTDYNCPYCRRAQPEVAAFVQSDGDVRHVVKALPYIGSDSAERAILAAADQADPETVAALHAAYMGTPNRLSDELVLDIAAEQGLDVDRLSTDMRSPAVEQRMSRTLRVARSLQIDGTPAFVMGGEVLGGLRSRDDLAAIAEAVRAEGVR